MQQTPIEFFKNKVEALMDAAYTAEEAISIALPESLKYEKQRLRDVAENAWDESSDVFCGYNLSTSAFIENDNKKKTYLNQNHPL